MKQTQLITEANIRLYRIYHGMKARCVTADHIGYKNYGEKGIKVLWESLEDFKADMFPAMIEHIKQYGFKDTTLDRIDSNGHYCKENCRWATWKEQIYNRSNTRLLEFNGETKTITEWSEKLGFSYKLIYNRLVEGWSIEKTLTVPMKKYKKRKSKPPKITK